MIKRLKTGITCPLAIPALFLAAGIASGRYGPSFSDLQIYTALALAAAINIYLLSRRNKSYLLPLSLALAFFVIGNASLARIKPPSLDRHLATLANSGQDCVFSGILRTAPSFNGSKGKFIVDADLVKTDTGTAQPLNTRILLKTTFPPPANLIPGDRLLIRASLSIPTDPGTPGGFNYRQYLADRQIPVTGFIRSATYLSPLPAASSPDNLMGLRPYLPQYLRYKTNLFIDSSALPLKIRALYKAIITGQRDSMPIKVLDNFKRSGAIHLLAISGMHMGLLALFSGLLLNYLFRKSSWLMLRWPVWKVAAILTLLIMGCYAAISGLQPPVVRAFIMASMLIVAIVLDRPKSMLNSIALAALLILFYEPTALFSVSFQLSFIAVTAIILFSNQFPAVFSPDQSQLTLTCQANLWLRTGLSVSVVALFATAPITLYHFHQVSLLGPITTILTAPLLCFWALPLGLTAVLFYPWLPNVAAFILSIGSVGLTGADVITATLAAIPFTSHIRPPPALATIATYYLIAGTLLFCKTGRKVKVCAALAMILILNIPTSSFYRGKDPDLTRITFLDVGQGSAALLELPGDMNILLDGGGSSSPRFNPGEQIIGPFLWHQSIRRLNALIISHGHQDHYNGLDFIIREFRPAEVWINGSEGESREYLDILRAAAETGAKIRVPGKDTVIAKGGAAELTSISNLHLRQDPDLPVNSRSLVIKLAIDGQKIILPGDIMADDGQNLINQGVDLQCDVLLAPHHGSRHSAGYQLVKAGNPKWLVVSASPFNSDNFPAPEFSEWCRQQGTTMLNTATSGAITFTVGAGGQPGWQTTSEKSATNKKTKPN